MKEELAGILGRLSDWAYRQGGYSEIGRRLKKSPAAFYNLVSRGSLPSIATLSELAIAYPDLDLNYLIRGKAFPVESEIEELKRQIKLKDAIICKLVEFEKEKAPTSEAL